MAHSPKPKNSKFSPKLDPFAAHVRKADMPAALPQYLENIVKPNKMGPSSVTPVPAAEKMRQLAEYIKPTEDEKQRAGNLLTSFSQFNQAMRCYALVKYADGDPKDMEAVTAFANNPNPEFDDEELYKLGWPSFAALMQDLSLPVLQLEARGFNAEKGLPCDPAVAAICEKNIVPVIKRYEDTHGIFGIDASEEEHLQSVRRLMPSYAMVVQAMMHDKETRGLYAVLRKQAFGEKLSKDEVQLMDGHQQLVEAAQSMLRSAGLGYAVAPCNQIYRESELAARKWTSFMKEAHNAQREKDQGHDAMADQHYEAAMADHKDALGILRKMHQALGPVCKLVGNIEMLADAKLDGAVLDRAASLARALPAISDHQKIQYNRQRIVSAFEKLARKYPAEKEMAARFVKRSDTVNAYAATIRKDSDDLLGHIETLRQAIKDSGGSIPISDSRFRNVFMNIRSLSGRMELMAASAEQLYADMGRVTGKEDAAWRSVKTLGDRDAFTAPSHPGPALTKLAEDIQRNCALQHELATGHRAELLEVVDAMGGEMDVFDVVHDYFSCLRDTLGEQVASMEVRQAKWDNAHPGAAALRQL